MYCDPSIKANGNPKLSVYPLPEVLTTFQASIILKEHVLSIVFHLPSLLPSFVVFPIAS